MIAWRPIAEMPESLKDGREVLLWHDEGPPQSPGAEVGTWNSDHHWSQDDDEAPGYWEALYECAAIAGVTHFAEINPP